MHGFTDKAMHLYIGTSEDPLQIVRGGIFGGTLPSIEVCAKQTVCLIAPLNDWLMCVFWVHRACVDE